MAKKTLVLTLDGQEVALKFNWATLLKMKSLAGNDPFRSVGSDDMLAMGEFAKEIINAGVMTALGMDEPFYTDDQLNDFLNMPLITDVVIAFTKAYAPDKPEVEADTQSSPANV